MKGSGASAGRKKGRREEREKGRTCSSPPLPFSPSPFLASRPVRVCFMIDKLFPAGIELQLLLLIKQLDRSRVEPSLCLLDGSDELTRSLEPTDCPVIRLGVRRLLRPSSMPPAFRLAQFFRRQKIDLVHPLFPDSLYFGTVVAKMSGVPCVAGFQVSLGYWMTRRDRWFGTRINKWVDATVANCEAAARAVVADRRVPRIGDDHSQWRRSFAVFNTKRKAAIEQRACGPASRHRRQSAADQEHRVVRPGGRPTCGGAPEHVFRNRRRRRVTRCA